MKAKAKKPQDLTDYSLRGLKRALASLQARVKALEVRVQAGDVKIVPTINWVRDEYGAVGED